jgi:hypothetical protein
LVQNTGVLSAPITTWEGGSYNYVSGTTTFSFVVTLTDTRGAGSSVSTTLTLTYNNSLRITTPNIATVVPLAHDFLLSGDYSFQMQAAGGSGTYTWKINPAANLPAGIVPASSTSWNGAGGGGLFGGVYTGATGASFPISITLTDGMSSPVVQGFTVNTGTVALGIDDSGVGTIYRGVSYQGTLSVGLCATPPVQWQVAPTTAYTNILPTGLSLAANGNGLNAAISGTYSGVILTNYPVRIIAVDSLGNTGVVLLSVSTGTDLKIIGWDTVPSTGVQSFPLPNATITASYPFPPSTAIQLIATGGVPPYSWADTPTAPLNGISFASNGQLSGTLASAFSTNPDPVLFTVTDSLTPGPANSYPLTVNLTSQVAGLRITTSSIATFTAGLSYASLGTPPAPTLNATLGTTPYTFSVSPATAHSLPTGLTLTTVGNIGYIVGTSTASGWDPGMSVTFRVTDNTGAYADAPLTVEVMPVLKLQTGIDYTDGTSTGFLGFIDAGNVRRISPCPNLSFYIVATGVLSTSPSQMTVTVANSGITAMGWIILTPGVAQIQLSGAGFDLGVGTYSLGVTVVDSGVSLTTVFTWTVFNDGALVLAPTSGSLPTQAVG